jgi:hypothetical protein
MDGIKPAGPDHRIPALLEADLPAVAAASLRRSVTDLAEVQAESITPPGANMTTGGLWRITGTARAHEGDGRPGDQPFSVVAKLTQSPLLWSGIDVVPPDLREQLGLRYPWRTEAQAYASGLAAALPDVAWMPDAYLITEIDPQRTLIWMADAAGAAANWSDSEYAHAAYALGRISGSPDVAGCVAQVADATTILRLRFYLEGVGSQLLIPMIQGNDIWQHPAVTGAADEAVITGLRRLADDCWDLMDGLVALPQLPVHGDASPQNLMLRHPAANGSRTGFAVVDWGNFGRGPAGFDLAQLLAGRVNSGDLSGDQLHRLAPLCGEAYCEGMSDAGAEPVPSEVRHGMVAALALFSGLGVLPFDRLGGPPTPGLDDLVAGRLEMARFILGALDAGW